MSSAFLCVQFRNLLPSEQLVLLARALWSDLQAAGVQVPPGDAVLAIAQLPGDPSRFEVELTLPGLGRRGPARDADAAAAVDAAFALWTVGRRGLNGTETRGVVGEGLGESATIALSG